jgi:hypothetical protein
MGRTYPNEIKRILAMPGGDVGKECRQVAMLIAKEARLTAEKQYGRNPLDRPRTGALALAYRVEVIPGTNQFKVRNPKKYAAAMELGAKEHTITARRTQYLQFRGRDGRWRRVKFVKHPGSIARRTLLTSARVVMRRRYGVS